MIISHLKVMSCIFFPLTFRSCTIEISSVQMKPSPDREKTMEEDEHSEDNCNQYIKSTEAIYANI